MHSMLSFTIGIGIGDPSGGGGGDWQSEIGFLTIDFTDVCFNNSLV